VRRTAATKAPDVQIRPAHAGTEQPPGADVSGTIYNNIFKIVTCPQISSKPSRSKNSNYTINYYINRQAANFSPLPNDPNIKSKISFFYINWAISHDRWAIWAALFGLF
jgi:hypothetical protein